MTTAGVLETARKKQLGQYFTDPRVGRLLAALAGAESARTIIDPMVGSADLLLSCLAVGSKPDRLVGLDLDPLAVSMARESLREVPQAEVLVGDAFSLELPPEQFDLVITNPPYIRYQSKGEVDGVPVPSASSVRAGLVRAICSRPGLSQASRALWMRAAQTYPGTSDVAVPAWLLSAALVREGGVLAVVAPQTWLSRNYAHAVRELLDSAFEVEVIVDDGDAAWFNDAQVRTQLVVARRRADASSASRRSVVRARATREFETEGSLLGEFASEADVAAALRSVTDTRSNAVTRGLTAYVEHNLSTATAGGRARLPGRVAAALQSGVDVESMRTLESYGWRVGQGLRTGANDFFYVDVDGATTRPATRWGIAALPIPAECLLPAVRRQSDVGKCLTVDPDKLDSRIVNFRGWFTAADMQQRGSGGQLLPGAVDRWIEQVAVSPLSAKGSPRLFPDLTAVATNVKTDRAGRLKASWYQLPELAERHRPALLLGRVCGGRPKFYFNPSAVIVDANFAGLWPTGPNAIPVEAALALLNSSWVWANLETTCTVLGGGALKVEATDLRRLALPDLSIADVALLTRLGRRAAREFSAEVQSAIDEAVARVLVRGEGETPAKKLHALAVEALRHRSR